MDIQAFLRLLTGVKGPSPSGDYVARCPAHDDKTASLCVKAGEKGIVLKCQAGCDTQSVVHALGLKIGDLFYDRAGGAAPAQGAAKGRQGQRKPAGKTPHQPPSAAASGRVSGSEPEEPVPQRGDGSERRAPGVRREGPQGEAAESSGEAKGGEKKGGGLGEVVCTYPYTDESGKLLYEVVRFKQEDGSKTFRQRVRDESRPGGYRWSLEGVRRVIYRLPQVREAIREDLPLFVVEGEKDCETLAGLGYCATTCPMGAGKWDESYTKSMEGAGAVYIIPDNDGPEQKFVGQQHAMAVARALTPGCREVRLLDLTSICPELPIKGDVTDMLTILGEEKGMKALAQLMALTEPLDRQELKDLATAASYYKRVTGYCVDSGCICQMGAEEGQAPRRLANFVALPRAVVTRDDGVSTEKVMVISGWAVSGLPLPRAKVPAKSFANMGWVAESWDFAANILPGNTTKDKLRYVIAEVGKMTARRSIEYTHTGWRKIGGRWAYLYQGGAIGADRVTVDLGYGMGRYGFGRCEHLDARRAAEASYGLHFVMDDAVAVPLLGMTYLAPLREFLSQTGSDPAFSLFLCGGTGVRKSTAAALALSHFGDFNSRSLPASFNDTANYIRTKAFKLKDSVIVVDDYHPVTSLQERKKMEGIAQSLSRAFGDLAERGRMNADRSLQESNPPRSLAIISGEDMPTIGQSGMSRYYVVTVGEKSVPAGPMLTELQQKARDGYLRRAMWGYIEWLLPRAESLAEELESSWQSLRALAVQACEGQHGRSPEAVAHMILGYSMMMDYFVSEGVFDEESGKAEVRKAWRTITESSRKQAEELKEERPSRMFLDAMGELLTAKTAILQDLTDPESAVPIKGMAGYMDAQHYYFLPDLAYGMVARLFNEQGLAFPLSKRMLYKQMREDGLLTADATGSKSTRNKSINGKAVRLLWVPRDKLEGVPGPRAVQQKIDTASGYAVTDDKTPFEAEDEKRQR